jgi:hypothetical protein
LELKIKENKNIKESPGVNSNNMNSIVNVQKKLKDYPKIELNAYNYFELISPYLLNRLISEKNYNEIKNLVKSISSIKTSFFGFEKRLDSDKKRMDYLLALSYLKGERESFLNLIKNKEFIENIKLNNEWKNINKFFEKWIDPENIFHKNILGIWLEFDTANFKNKINIPSVFLQISPIHPKKKNLLDETSWIINLAISTLTSKMLPEKTKKYLGYIISKMPKKSSILLVASMLSRSSSGLRIIIKDINADEIVTFLNDIGWNDINNRLSNLLDDIKKYANNIRLHININEKIDKKIGLECFISPEKYHKSKGWDIFLKYLVDNNLCLKENYDLILQFPGVDLEEDDQEFSFGKYQLSVRIPNNNYSKAIIRYISHIKILYKPDSKICAKAYLGVRMFGKKTS